MLEHSFIQKIRANTQSVNNHICVGLDPDPEKMPTHIDRSIDGIDTFLKTVIDVTQDKCVCYKPNISFFEALGLDGLHLLERICTYIPSHTPIIMDAKRGDIGNTSAKQASFIFDYFGADAVTLHPYMGEDSLQPFFDYTDKFHFVLALTSNPGAATFEKSELASGKLLYERVVAQCNDWHQQYGNVGLVVGGTQSELSTLRQQTDLLFLIPGVGAQGGDYHTVVEQGRNAQQLALVNMSRGILYVDNSTEFASHIETTLTAFSAS